MWVWSRSKTIHHLHHTQNVTTSSFSFLLILLLVYPVNINILNGSITYPLLQIFYRWSHLLPEHKHHIWVKDSTIFRPNSLLSSRHKVMIPYWTSLLSWKHPHLAVPLHDCLWSLSIHIGWYLILTITAHFVLVANFFFFHNAWSQHIKLSMS